MNWGIWSSDRACMMSIYIYIYMNVTKQTEYVVGCIQNIILSTC